MKMCMLTASVLALLLIPGLAAQSAFPSGELGVGANWQGDLQQRYKTGLKPWIPLAPSMQGKSTVLPYSKSVRSADVVVRYSAGDTFIFSTKLGDANSDIKKLLREIDPADAVPLLFEVVGGDDGVSGCAVAHELMTSGANNSARAALAWTMRVNWHQREHLSKAASAILGEAEPENGFWAIPNPLSLVTKAKYLEFLDNVKKTFDARIKAGGDQVKKKAWNKGIGEIKDIHSCFEEIRAGLSETQVAEYESIVKLYEEAVIKVEDTIKDIMSMGSYDRLKSAMTNAKAATGSDLMFARKIAEAFAFKHDDVAKNQAEWLKDGREFRGSLISFGRAFADGKDDDQYGSKGYMRKVIGKMFAVRAYQDILEKVIDSATRNAKDAVRYSPDDPLCIKVEQNAEKLKKDTLKDFNAPGNFDNDKSFWVGSGNYQRWSRWYRYW